MKTHRQIYKMIVSSLFLALAYVMPFLTGQIQEIGAMLCPMHFPVLLCGFFCGPVWGAAVGLVAPILRSLTLGMPPLFPKAVCMAFELMTYGAVSGLLHKIFPRRIGFTYCALLLAMLAGRLVWGLAMFLFLGISGGSFTLAAFIAGAFTNAVPGIIVQIVLIPVIVTVLERATPIGRRL